MTVAHLIEVAFKGNRKEFFLWESGDVPPTKAAVIVEADRGEDLGHVHCVGDQAKHRAAGCAHGCGTATPQRKALRLASEGDVARERELRTNDDDARRKAQERVRANGLVMKVSDAEWQWDRKKLTLYFTADKRVDFRNLVRELASMFRARIELKQIGVRDEARRLDGVGRCGRQYCSAAWLPDLRPVNLGVAKDQHLSLNPSQISGACGRLMCCLRYEHEHYVQSRKRFPKEGRILRTKTGEEKVLANDIFRERVTLRSVEGETRVVALADLKRELSEADGDVDMAPATPEDETETESMVAEELMLVEEESTIELAASTFEMPPSAPRPTSAAPTALDAKRDPPDAKRGQAPGESSDASDQRPRRRRGRRGGRRGKPLSGPGSAPPPSSTPPPPPPGSS